MSERLGFDLEAADSLLATARARIEDEAEALVAVARSLDASFLAAVDLVRSAAGKVLVVGVGTSGPIARRMAHLLATSGTPSVFLHPADALHGGLGAVSGGDVVIAISKGGQSAELNDFAGLAKDRGAALLCLTAEGGSLLARLSDLTVVIPQTQAADPGGVIAMGSSLAVAAWGDALAVVLMQISGYSWTQVLEAHPSGAVGQRRAPSPGRGQTGGSLSGEGRPR
jgi:D-arabinose 5-phosphate isomerase GutQ